MQFVIPLFHSYLNAQSSAPLWIEAITYTQRIWMCAFLMSLSLLTVGFGESTGIKLVGVGLGSLGSALGEASFLGFSSFFSSADILTAWSSGTGLAGVFGYAWVFIFHVSLDMSMTATLVSANVLSVIWVVVYYSCFKGKQRQAYEEIVVNSELQETLSDEDEDVQVVATKSMSRRLCLVFELWRYTGPLFLVYMSEYAMQSGAWAAMGFPVTDKDARDKFYFMANWSYQGGVFLSRSSGSLFRMSHAGLWLLPVVQLAMLFFFVVNAVYHVWWNNTIVPLTFFAGLIGGLVYVHGFILLSKSIEDQKKREVALSTASVADTAGIMCANLIGIAIQGCLYRANNISDGETPLFTCNY